MTAPEAAPDGSSAPSLDDLTLLAQGISGARRVVLGTVTADQLSLHPPTGSDPVSTVEADSLRRVHASRERLEDADFQGLPLFVPDGAGELLGVLGIWGGTGGPLLEPLTRQLIAHLELHRRLGHTRRLLERADRLATVGRLAAGIAHELGTPLAVVAGRARQLAAGTVPAGETTAVARGIADQADRMAGIIRQLLDYARRRGPRPGRFDVRTLLRQVVALMDPVAARREVQLVLAELPVARVVRFDGSQMMQVMTNLVENALHATAAGGLVTLSLEEADLAPPADTGLPARRYLGLRVKDTGVGIGAEQLQQVFEPFFTTKDTGEGTGLGLSVAQGIVRDHDGWIAVESQLGQGSSFIVQLPG